MSAANVAFLLLGVILGWIFHLYVAVGRMRRGDHLSTSFTQSENFAQTFQDKRREFFQSLFDRKEESRQ
jgi:hypothetical protein